jgi:hypothetical protein
MWTHLKQIESLNWTLPLDPSLHLGSSKDKLSILALFLGSSNKLIFIPNGAM